MRVLAVGNMYPPHHLGGYELVWRSAMRDLRSEGWDVRVLTTDYRGGAGGEEDAETFRELRWYWRDHEWPALGWRARVALERHNGATLRRHLAEFRPDVVSWWSMGGMSLSLIESVRRRGIPAIAFVHDDWLLYGPRMDRWSRAFQGRRCARLAPIAERLTGVPARVDLERAARYVFVSETVRANARAEGYELADSGVAHSGIDAAYLDPRPEQPWGWRLLCVGRLDVRKGADDAVAALAELPKPATLTVVGGGNGDELSRVRSVVAAHGVTDRVRLLGMRSRTELLAEYEAADVVVFPVRWREPWGLVPLEAMALGRPVISTGAGGPGEYMHDGENGLIVAAENPAAIALAVRRLESDPSLRARLRSGGLRTAAAHTEADFNRAVAEELSRAAAAKT